MAMESVMKRLLEESTCPICLDYFGNPVLLDCGHNFCEACITKCWEDWSQKIKCSRCKNNPPCPQCKERIVKKRMQPNLQVGNFAQCTKDLNEIRTAKEACKTPTSH